MRSVSLTAALAIAVLTTLAAQSPQPRFSTSVNLLVVSAIVRSADNALIRGLTRDDFELLEDGKPVPLVTFAEAASDARASIDDGRFIVLLLDDLSTHPQFTDRIKSVAHGFANRMGPKDVMSVVLLNGGSSVTTQRPAEIHAAIDRTRGYGNGSLSSVTGSNTKHAVETIASLSSQLARVPHRRKVLICIGAVQTFNVPTHVDGFQGDAGRAMRETSLSNVTTYVIDPLGLTEKASLATRAIDAGRLDEGIAAPTGVVSKGAGFQDHRDGFAFETGGLAFANTNLYEQAINQVWEESGNYYLLGYEPARRDNRRHSIEVRVKKPGAAVRARRTRG
jgi:VWFA-related protein